MISFVKGKIIEVDEQAITVELPQCALGIQLSVTNATSYVQNKEVALHAYMHWNQEQGPSLFGFTTKTEKRIFVLMISCSGVGPKMALSALSQMQPAEFVRAVHENDAKALSTINGIGAKKAEQIIVQLKHKVAKLIDADLVADDSGALKQIKGVSDVLLSLNYSRPEIAGALDYVKGSGGGQDCSFDQALRLAVSFLSKRV